MERYTVYEILTLSEFGRTGDIGQIAVHGGALGPLADAVSDSVASRSAAFAAGIVEGIVPIVLGSMVVSVGFGSAFDAAADEPPATAARRRRYENDAGGRPPFGDGNQDNPGILEYTVVHLSIVVVDFLPFIFDSFSFFFFSGFTISSPRQELMSRYRQLSPDGSECGCLKAIAVFKPGKKCIGIFSLHLTAIISLHSIFD